MAEGREKYCPILNISSERSVKCREGRCAWWVAYPEIVGTYKKGGNCAIRDIAAELITLRTLREYEINRQERLARKADWYEFDDE